MAAPAAAPTWLDDADLAAQKHEEAVADAVEKCADDTKGQTCYICTEAVKEETNEGLVSGFCACRGGLSFAHVSCLARQAQVEVERDAQNGWKRWHTCRQCEQKYHGVVRCALGWACWKTYLGRPEADQVRAPAMGLLGLGLSEAGHNEDALSVQQADLATLRRIGATEPSLLDVQCNLAITYEALGRFEAALRLKQDVYSGRLRLNGEEHRLTFLPANNYAASLQGLSRFEEAKTLLRRTLPAAQRVLGMSHEITLRVRLTYARALYKDPAATLDELRESVTTFEDVGRIARRVLGSSHPVVVNIEQNLGCARETLRAREEFPSLREAMALPEK